MIGRWMSLPCFLSVVFSENEMGGGGQTKVGPIQKRVVWC